MVRVFHSGGRYLVWQPQDIYDLRANHRIVGALIGSPNQCCKGVAAEPSPPLALSPEEVVLLAELGAVSVLECNGSAPPAEDVPTFGAAAAAAAGGSSGGGDGGGDTSGGAEAGGGGLVLPKTGFVSIARECSDWREASLPPLTAEALRERHAERRPQVRVFRALWDAGCYLSCGLKFGGDFLAYTDDPMRCHAAAVVTVLPAPPPAGRDASATRPPASPLRAVQLGCLSRMAAGARKLALLAFVPSGADGRVDFRAIDGAHRVVPFEAAALAGWDFGEWRDEARGAGAGAKRKRRGSTGVDLHLKVR